ncbi:DUF775-domain-containing protein [Vararia minispora EC-137]|uniref:DUF775-domain-containing protein n=1 Tax=Vararia minispora EC-137 TaxID=1314806 RepID=A0ACB8QYW2_9AGAM|nr:DUF775-domain-containing protein [Vararia minispora EC-137]
MFGCLVAGRLPQTNLQQVDETHAVFELPAASSINHICVFLLGSVPFPDGYGATVHFHWPGRGFQLLGMLSNGKPSAIFRLRGTFTSQSSNTNAAFNKADQPTSGSDVTAILGIAIEPLLTIQAEMSMLPSSVAKASAMTDPTILAEQIVKNLFNYVSGFVSGNGQSITPDNAVPVGLLAKWYENFISKIKTSGMAFLDNTI